MLWNYHVDISKIRIFAKVMTSKHKNVCDGCDRSRHFTRIYVMDIDIVEAIVFYVKPKLVAVFPLDGTSV